MSIKKALLLAVMAIAAIAVAAPASALAAPHLQMEGEEITETETETFSGTFGTETLGGGIECGFTAAVVIQPGGEEGEATTFDPEEASCETFGALESCQIHGPIVVEELAWSMFVASTHSIKFEAGESLTITTTYSEKGNTGNQCSFPHKITWHFSEMLWIIASFQTSSITTLSLEAEGFATFEEAFELGSVLSGSVVPANAGTYGIAS